MTKSSRYDNERDVIVDTQNTSVMDIDLALASVRRWASTKIYCAVLWSRARLSVDFVRFTTKPF